MSNPQAPPITSVASAVADHAGSTASTAADETRRVAGTATEGAREVMSEAAQAASQVKQQASAQTRELLEQAQNRLRDQAASQTTRASGAIRDVSQQLKSMAEARPESGGVAENGVRQAAERLDQLAARLEERGLEGTVDDVRQFARQRPGLFLLGATAAGFAVGRLAKGLQAAKEAENGSTARTLDIRVSSAAARPDLPPTLPVATADMPAGVPVGPEVR